MHFLHSDWLFVKKLGSVSIQINFEQTLTMVVSVLVQPHLFLVAWTSYDASDLEHSKYLGC